MMNALMWNIRGIGNEPSMRHLKKLIKIHKSSIIFILEQKNWNVGDWKYWKKVRMSWMGL